MRRIVLLPFALSLLAACADAPTGPAAAPPSGANAADRSADEGHGPPPSVSPSILVAYNEGGQLYGQNLPLPDLGGGRVVWQDASAGDARVLSYDVHSGRRQTLGTAAGAFAYPATGGRYTIWGGSDGQLRLHDDERGTTEAVGSGGSYGAGVSGKLVAYVDYGEGVGNAAVYDPHTGQPRLLTHYTSASGEAVRSADVDGGVVAFSTYTTRSPYTTGIAYVDLGTGERHDVVRSPSQAIGQPSVSDGRIAWEDDRGGSWDVYVYDVAGGTTRQLTSDPAGQFNVRISGPYVVWEDTRNSESHYFPENDVYLYDLRADVEVPVATGPNHQGWPRVDGRYVLWTERANDRWEVRLAEITR